MVGQSSQVGPPPALMTIQLLDSATLIGLAGPEKATLSPTEPATRCASLVRWTAGPVIPRRF
jgi:hypothetical protein